MEFLYNWTTWWMIFGKASAGNVTLNWFYCQTLSKKYIHIAKISHKITCSHTHIQRHGHKSIAHNRLPAEMEKK